MMTNEEMLQHMEKMGKSVNEVMSYCASSEAMLKGILSRRDEMPEGMLDQLDKYSDEIREGRSKMNEELNKIQETFK